HLPRCIDLSQRRERSGVQLRAERRGVLHQRGGLPGSRGLVALLLDARAGCARGKRARATRQAEGTAGGGRAREAGGAVSPYLAGPSGNDPGGYLPFFFAAGAAGSLSWPPD